MTYPVSQKTTFTALAAPAAGQHGQAISLVSADEFPQLQAIEQLLGKNIERREVSGFEAQHRLPIFSKTTGSKQEKNKSGKNQPGKIKA